MNNTNLENAKYLVWDGLEFQAVDTCDYDNNSYKMISSVVDGYIEVVPHSTVVLPEEVDMYCNEEGKFREDLCDNITGVLVTNYGVSDVLVGNLVFTRTDKDGETVPLKPSDIKKILKLKKDGLGRLIIPL